MYCELRHAAQPATRIGLLVSSTSGMSEYEWGHDGEAWKDDVLMLLGRNKC